MGVNARASLLAAVCTWTACARPETPRPEPPLSTTTVSVPTVVHPAAAALEGEALGTLDIGSGESAFVALPVGAREPRAIVVGVHGAGDRPDWSCFEWQQVTAGWAFVVCPHGVVHPRDPQAFVWGSAEAIASRADRAVAALRMRYGAWALDAPLVYAGWSQGGTLAAAVVRSRPGVYDRVVLVEVGHTPLDADAVAAGLVSGGVTQAVLSCSSWNCRSFAHSFAPVAQRRGITLRTVDVGNRGHWFDEPVFRALAPTFAATFEEDVRFTGLAAAIDARWTIH
jgi:hypothetical protein